MRLCGADSARGRVRTFRDDKNPRNAGSRTSTKARRGLACVRRSGAPGPERPRLLRELAGLEGDPASRASPSAFSPLRGRRRVRCRCAGGRGGMRLPWRRASRTSADEVGAFFLQPAEEDVADLVAEVEGDAAEEGGARLAGAVDDRLDLLGGVVDARASAARSGRRSRSRGGAARRPRRGGRRGWGCAARSPARPPRRGSAPRG